MYYILNFNIEDAKKDMWFNGTIYNSKQDVEANTFDEGSLLKGMHEPFTIVLNEKESATKNRVKKDKVSTYVIESGVLFLVSSKAKSVFEKLQMTNLQYFDAIVKGVNIETGDYKIINILTKIDCTNFDASDLELYSNGDIDMINSLVLDESKIPAKTMIFLLGKTSTGVIIVHEDFKNIINSNGLTGFNFINLEDAGQFF